eukprot:gene34897-43030_t
MPAMPVATRVQATRPHIVLHLAAQALVRAGYADPLGTHATNVMGTAHVLDALRGQSDVRAVVVVTTDKVYRNREWAYPYREDDALGGHDPYSASKAATELVTASYRDSFLAAQGIAVATARAGNVIGGGDWAQDRLLPDAVRAWEKGATLHIRRPQATRPWQHVLEPLAAYLRLAQRLWESPALAGAYNFGPLPHEAATVKNVIELASTAYPASATSYENESEGPHEAGWLALETARLVREFPSARAYALDAGDLLPETPRARNFALSFRVNHCRLVTSPSPWRHPRHRIFRALALLLWEPAAFTDASLRRRLAIELGAPAHDLPTALT